MGVMDLFKSSSVGQFQFLLSAVQSTSKTPNMNQSAVAVQSTGQTPNKSQWLVNPEETARLWQMAWVRRSSKKQREYQQRFFSVFLSTKSWQVEINDKIKVNQCKSVVSKHQGHEAQRKPAKCCKVKQGETVPEHHSLSFGLYLYFFQTACVLSSIHSSITSHALSPGSF